MNATRVRAALVVIVAAAFLSASCSTIESPKLKLKDVEFESLSTDGMEFDVKIEVVNPNSFEAHAGALEYEAFVNGISVARGQREEEVTVPAGGAVMVRIPLTLTWEGSTKALREVLDGGDDLEWGVEGRVTLRKGPYRKRFEFSEKGSFDMPDEAPEDA